jgi:hypothetical protein
MSKISVSRYNILHGSFLVMNLFGLVWYCMEIFNLHYLIKYFSVQAFWLAIFYSITSFVKSTRNSKITQILYELSFTTNMIACLGYWIIVRPHVLKLIPSIFYIKLVSFTLCNDLTHTMPILMLILIHYLEHLQYFHLKNLKYQAYLLTFAIIVNVFYTFWDAPVYHFMTYEDIGTPIFLTGGLFVLILIFFTMNKITEVRSKNVKN